MQPDEARIRRRGRIEIQGGKSLTFIEDPDAGPAEEAPAALLQAASQVAKTLKEYLKAAKALLETRYSDVRDLAPAHLRDLSDVTVLCCPDGMIVRYDQHGEGEAKARSAALPRPVAELTPQFSDLVVHVAGGDENDLAEGGIEIELTKVNSETGETDLISKGRFAVIAPAALDDSVVIPPPPSRQPALVSLTNELQVIVEGIVMPAEGVEGNIDTAREFVATSKMKLAVGWEAFELYPAYAEDYWKPEFAPLRAETDVLAAAARQHFTQAGLAAIDPNVAARHAFRGLLTEFERLLQGPEEPAHQFLKKHPELLSPSYTAAWSKLRLGDRVTDFVFREPGHEYLFVEIESPLRRIFRRDGQQREELTHAFNQIVDWRIFIQDNLETVREDLGLSGMSPDPESLIVIGRSDGLTDDDRRKITALQGQIPRLRILTYDDLIAHAKAVAENLFGPIDPVGENVEIYYRPRAANA